MNELRIPQYQIHHGNNLDILKNIPSESIDSIVTDPPYEIAFMGRGWDSTGAAYNQELWSECLRVLKAGGHLIAFGATRTIHRSICAIEDAGFEIRDMISWLYFSGFPKSLDISKAIDKHFGAEREVLYISKDGAGTKVHCGNKKAYGHNNQFNITAPSTEEAKKWDGWGTALKPAQEPAILARKPLSETSIARQVLSTGTGAINIDGCRFGYGDECWVGPQHNNGIIEYNYIPNYKNNVYGSGLGGGAWVDKGGRWPANIYQCAKPSRAERDAGLEHLHTIGGGSYEFAQDGSLDGRQQPQVKNFHPTVKPLKLMRWLCRLVTPPSGTILDPFAGSGTTLAAAVLEGFDSIGCELTQDYIPLIEGRCAWAIDEYKRENSQLSLTKWMES